MSDHRGAKAGEQPPISAHPAFPAIVALWFAALLGLGSLVLPPVLLERAASASGLASLVEAARPPLGVTARILVALFASVVGAVAGLLIARQVIASHMPAPTSRRAAALKHADADERPFAKRPISAHEELGADGFDAASPEPARPAIAGRRRALAMSDEGARSDFLEFAPLPGQAPGTGLEPLDLEAFAEPEPEPEETAPAVAEPVPASGREVPFGTASLSERKPFARPSESAMPTPVPMPFEPRMRVSTPDADAPVSPAPLEPFEGRALGELGMVELVERFALALERRQARAETLAAPHDNDEDPAPLVLPRLASPGAPAEPAVTPPVPRIPAALRPIGFDDDDSDEDSGFDGLGRFDFAAALNGQQRPFAAPTHPVAPPAELEADESDEEVVEDSYPSLLAMKSPLAGMREPVRIDEPNGAEEAVEPVVVFPNQGSRRAAPAPDGPARDVARPFAAPAGVRAFDRPDKGEEAAEVAAASPTPSRPTDPGETERALREALEKLQRLSGVA